MPGVAMPAAAVPAAAVPILFRSLMITVLARQRPISNSDKTVEKGRRVVRSLAWFPRARRHQAIPASPFPAHV
jgi:hypothetical protein